ncbi:hypothetical protein CPC08DRAFT_723104 [Agrocybe pediades]|nr:hypothetical protein CPC08DRAFT_723104 [Agrocybe pediades]
MDNQTSLPTYAGETTTGTKKKSWLRRKLFVDRDSSKKRWVRRYTLLECLLWSAAGAAFGTYAMVRINRERNSFLAALPVPNDVTYDNSTIRLPGIMTTVGCYLTFATSLLILIFSFLLKPSNDQRVNETVFLAICSFWLVICVGFETGYYATTRASIKGTVNGIVISDTIIAQIENVTGIRTVYRFGFAYLLVAIICSWFAAFWTAVSTAVHGTSSPGVPSSTSRSAAPRTYSHASRTTATTRSNSDPNYSEEKDIVEEPRTLPPGPVAVSDADPEAQGASEDRLVEPVANPNA